MLIQFNVVKDNSCWTIDNVLMNYVRSERFEKDAPIEERGKLVFVGMQGILRVFALEGRAVGTDGPGDGLCIFGYAMHEVDTTLTYFIQCNVPVANLNSLRPIDTIRYELIPNMDSLNETSDGGSNERPVSTDGDTASPQEISS